MSVASSDGLHGASIFAGCRGQGDAAGNYDTRKVSQACHGHHHGRQTLVAGSDSQDPGAQWKGARQTAKDHGSVVAIRQAVEHPDCALGSSIAWVRAETSKWDHVQPPKFIC